MGVGADMFSTWCFTYLMQVSRKLYVDVLRFATKGCIALVALVFTFCVQLFTSLVCVLMSCVQVLVGLYV